MHVALFLAADKSSGGGWPVWATPALAFLGVVVGAGYTAWRTSRREQTARRNQAQRTALYELQATALDLRRALRKYGKQADDSTTDAVDEATGKLEMIKYRVREDKIRTNLDLWLKTAQAFFTGDETVTVKREEGAWSAVQENVGDVLRELD